MAGTPRRSLTAFIQWVIYYIVALWICWINLLFTSYIITLAVSKQGCTLSQQPLAAKRARMIDKVWQNPQSLQLQNT
ncbi:hypothetical protein NIES4072_68330 [Nostoc commune NIES-4072]|uniref:Uncharacterized protein n=1 Tax=Nostoc commune NIES-4072 TaxID=2005467 RepID=A0A2R5G4Z7_NOSCO|nr:hypothetical protein [Nostoc commune]BBD70466.1 hypothetical protein NIES4070_68770 [Nostoc commune HK-02]GBG23121.1 hypothetical protein NIES4072_68330 [Nostoc commune NIES-4072]